MAASWPAAKKTFAQIVNGVTKLVALIFNTGYDEIEAIQTSLGATGRAQTYSASMKELLLQYQAGCGIEYVGVTSVKIHVGEIMIPDASNNVGLRRNISEVTLTMAGNMDSGSSEKVSTWYDVYVTADNNATTFLGLITELGVPPDDATYYRKVGKFYNDDGSDIVENSVMNINGMIPDVAEIRIGTYTGDNNATQAIVGLGFKPDSIKIIEQISACYIGTKNDQDGTKTMMTTGSSGVYAYQDDHIVSFDADGFTVGDGTGTTNKLNQNAQAYSYVALKMI